MANFREIVTKAVIGKGKKTFTNTYTLTPEQKPSTILGCWIINHNFKGYKSNDSIVVDGSFDINIWYSYNDDKETFVTKKNVTYSEVLKVSRKTTSDISSDEEVIIRSLRQPTCTNVAIKGNNIEYSVEKELGAEIVGDTKVRIAIDEDEDDWEELVDDDDVTEAIDKEVNENFISDENKG